MIACNSFQDARAFLKEGGQRGRQLGMLNTGTYRINTKLFTIITAENAAQAGLTPADLRVYRVDMDKVGIVTALDGKQIQLGDIAGPQVWDHNSFQNGQIFIDNDGRRGLQEEVLMAGAYNLNPWLVRVEQVPLAHIPVGAVGVVIAHVGKRLANETSEILVDQGYKGIYKTPLQSGHHPINPRVMDIEIVPTSQIALEWSDEDKPAFNYDSSLHAIELRSNDGYNFKIKVTQKIRIAEQKAPEMIWRVGTTPIQESDQNSEIQSSHGRYRSIRNLIVRVLEPVIEAHFHSSAQGRDALDFLYHYREREREAMTYIEDALNAVGVRAEGTFIQKIDLPNDLKDLLQARTRAEEEKKTLRVQLELEVMRQKLAEAIAITNSQAMRVEGETQNALTHQRDRMQIDMINALVDILGREGYIRREQIMQFVNLRLPNTIFGSSGPLEQLFATYLGTHGTQQGATVQPDSSQFAEQVLAYLRDNPDGLQIILKSLTDQMPPTSGAEIDVTPPSLRITDDPSSDAAKEVGDQ